MKRSLSLILTAVLFFFSAESYAQRVQTINPSGEIINVERSVGDFSKISAGSGIYVEVAMSDTKSVKVKTDRNAINYVQTEVKNGTLYIKHSDKVAFNRIKTTVYVTVPKITDIVASSGSDIEFKGILRGDDLAITASSAADVSGAIAYSNVEIVASSGSDVEISGTAKTVTISASSGSDVDTEKLIAPKARATASSGSDVKVYASESLTATASSGSDIYYYGSPTTINNNTSSGASIVRK